MTFFENYYNGIHLTGTLPASHQRGFTFIEVIASLVIFGFLFAIAGMGIVIAAKGYMLTKENAHMAQKSQLALVRLHREFGEMVNIVAKDNTLPYLIYDHFNERRAVVKDGNTIRLFSNLGAVTSLPAMSQGDVLIDDIDSLILRTWKGSDPWVLGSDAIMELTTVEIAFVMNRMESDVDSQSFTTVVRPRNTRR